MRITKEMVFYVAELSRIRLDETQAEKMQAELGAVIEYVDILRKIDTEGIEPLSHVFPIVNVMREDVAEPSTDRELLLANAPERAEETVIVPRAVE